MVGLLGKGPADGGHETAAAAQLFLLGSPRTQVRVLRFKLSWLKSSFFPFFPTLLELILRSCRQVMKEEAEQSPT